MNDSFFPLEDLPDDTDIPAVKVVFVGDGAVGKTSLLMRYTEDRFPTEYVPTIFENLTTGVVLKEEEQQVQLELWDTAGQEDYARLRSLSYPETDVFVLCFCVVDSVSSSNLVDKWYPECSSYVPDAKFLVAGTKVDLRESDDHKDSAFTNADGLELSEKLNAIAYRECSALTGDGVKAVVEDAIRVGLGTIKKDAKKGGSGGGGDGASKRRGCTLF